MKIYRLSPTAIMEFEWDEGNSAKNPRKHGVTNEETEEAFFGPTLVLEDLTHSQAEKRFHLLGATFSKRILFIVYTVRGQKIRVISSRAANRKERQIYYGKTS